MLTFCSTKKTVDALRLVDVLKDTGNFLDDQRSKSERRLIDQKKSRARDQRPADAEHLLLAPAQCAGGLFLALSQTRKVGVDPIDGSIEAGVDATAVCAHAQVFTHGQVLEDAAPLRDVANSQPHDLVRAQPADVASVKQHLPAARPNEARDRLERACLAGPVGAHAAGDFPLADGQRNAMYDLDPPVRDPEIVELEHASVSYV